MEEREESETNFGLWAIIGAVALLFGLSIAGWDPDVGIKSESERANERIAQLDHENAKLEWALGGIGWDEYEAIRIGDTLDRVRKVIGSDGKNGSENRIGGVHTLALTWHAESGRGGALMVFQDGRLIQKSQSGL